MDKTYMDDKGYMVTKKEYESASESDTEELEKKITPKKHEKVKQITKNSTIFILCSWLRQDLCRW